MFCLVLQEPLSPLSNLCFGAFALYFICCIFFLFCSWCSFAKTPFLFCLVMFFPMLQKLALPPLNSCFGALCCVLFDGIIYLFCNCVLSCVASFYNNTTFFTKTSIATSSSSLKLILLKEKLSQHSFLIGCNFLFHFACVFYCKNCYFLLEGCVLCCRFHHCLLQTYIVLVVQASMA
jgi:hypothetical protein